MLSLSQATAVVVQYSVLSNIPEGVCVKVNYSEESYQNDDTKKPVGISENKGGSARLLSVKVQNTTFGNELPHSVRCP